MKQINNTQTKDFIAEAIRNEILAGRLKAGEELTQEALAETLGVSRMPVREALQTLVQEGFVERLPNRHMQVVALNHKQIKETFRLIGVLESEITELLLDNEYDTRELDDLITAIKDEKIASRQIQLELEFHFLLTKLLDNKYLEQMYGKLIRGYVSYAIENLGEPKMKADLLVTIKEVIRHKDVAGLKNAFLEYYEYYAEQFKDLIGGLDE
ncbi:MAG: GntR family transcriptional regulator [Lachnospiraceae bacterium]